LFKKRALVGFSLDERMGLQNKFQHLLDLNKKIQQRSRLA